MTRLRFQPTSEDWMSEAEETLPARSGWVKPLAVAVACYAVVFLALLGL